MADIGPIQERADSVHLPVHARTNSIPIDVPRHQKANAGTLIRSVYPLQHLHLEDLILQAASPRLRFVWRSADGALRFVTEGELTRFHSRGPDRFNRTQEWCSAITRQVQGANEHADLPMFVGGFAFAEEGDRRHGPWTGWEDGMVFIPRRILFEKRGEHGRVQRGMIVHQWENERTNDDAGGDRPSCAASRTVSRPHAKETGLTPGEREAFEHLVRRAVCTIGENDLDKVVLARSRRFAGAPGTAIDSNTTLIELLNHHPGSHVFGLDRGEAGSFVGASPETMLEARGERLSTHALAGTTTRGTTAEHDAQLAQALLANPKERNEHAWVVRGIVQALAPFCRDMTIAETPDVMALPTLQHLSTAIAGAMTRPMGLLDAIAQVHPSPALCGSPFEAARDWIAAHEALDRGWYGGPIGWLAPDGSGHFAVAIRAALLRDGEASAFGGAGLVRNSQPEREWLETELKIDAVAKHLVTRELPR